MIFQFIFKYFTGNALIIKTWYNYKVHLLCRHLIGGSTYDLS